MKKTAFYLILLVAFCSACGEKDPIIGKNDVFTFVYNDDYVLDINLYQGEKGRNASATEKDVSPFFLIPLSYSGVEKIVIDLKKNTSLEISVASETKYEIALRNDSVFYLDYYWDKTPVLAGFFNADKSKYTYCKAFYYCRNQNEQMKFETSGTVMGEMSFDDAFKAENLMFDNHAYGFNSPAEMKNKDDVVSWINVHYSLALEGKK